MPERTPHPLWRVVNGAFIAASPFVLYFAVTRADVATAGWIVVAWIGVRTVPTWLAAPREHLRATLRLPLVALIFALLGALTAQRVLILLLPSLTQLGFAWVFGSTLRAGQTPLIERFARMQKANLDADERAHCRLFTGIWAAAMVLSAWVGVGLAAWAPTWAWAAFAGIGSYAFVAVLFAVEYLVRAFRFRHFGDNVLQRLLLRVMS